MAAYGALVSAPLGHVLIGILQKVFANRTTLKAKILQILASNLIVRSISAVILFRALILFRWPPSKTPSTSPPWLLSPERVHGTKFVPLLGRVSCQS